MSEIWFHCDLDDGRYAALGCLYCRSDVMAKLAMAHPVRFYVASLDCSECLEPLAEFDVIAETVSFEGIRSNVEPEAAFLETL